ncbi:CvpA family protein [Rhodoferax sp.]|jgi:membrane protein required for colicin V production|uniref:CvpA family protein n=1 Tax=Rhodoferax sp. TaxID=50421 RepID=UPI0008C9BAF0|nr:CvpA family protein [Rhodoferax sp.]MDO8320621.1 CvpA family protein [Rhodoferax sp.]MDP2680094.1 CvpA family protein [Rhodoferax sp.]OGB81484.1 MAG: colicin V synthesis protein [Burkholderiales bacterium RIFOXYD2_FULL_59_8]
MPVLDWVFAVVLLMSVLLGAWRGLVFEVLSLLSWVAAFVLAQWLALDVAQYLPMSGASDMVRYGAGFLLVFIATAMFGGLLASLLKKLMASVGLRPVDRVLGAAFGAVRGVLLLLLGTLLAAMTPVKSSAAWQESKGVVISMSVLHGLQPSLPRDLVKYLPA